MHRQVKALNSALWYKIAVRDNLYIDDVVVSSSSVNLAWVEQGLVGRGATGSPVV